MRIAALAVIDSSCCSQSAKKKILTIHRRIKLIEVADQPFSPTAPDQVWVTDITYIPTDEGWLCLAGLKDVFTCEIVGYAMDAG